MKKGIPVHRAALQAAVPAITTETPLPKESREVITTKSVAINKNTVNKAKE